MRRTVFNGGHESVPNRVGAGRASAAGSPDRIPRRPRTHYGRFPAAALDALALR
ncbi:hypothetical protein ACWEFL_09145 [Streptomyces sp. NPDC004838]